MHFWSLIQPSRQRATLIFINVFLFVSLSIFKDAEKSLKTIARLGLDKFYIVVKARSLNRLDVIKWWQNIVIRFHKIPN